MISNYIVERLSEKYIKQYAEAVISDWYNEYQLNKYKGNMTIEQLSAAILKEKDYRYVIIKNNELIGGIALIDDKYISYFIVPEYRNNGIATDILKEFTKKVIETNYEVYIQIMKGNKASMRVGEKVGYSKISENKLTVTLAYSR